MNPLDFKALVSVFFTDPDQVRLERIAKSGASGPKVVIVSHNGRGERYALKYGTTRVPISTQLENLAALQPHFGDFLVRVVESRTGLPRFDSAILMEAYETTLHDQVMAGDRPEEDCAALWGDVLDQFQALWRRTQAPFRGSRLLKRDPVTRLCRVEEALKGFHLPGLGRPLGAHWSSPLLIQGIEYPSLESTFSRLAATYRPPTVEVICHGDPNADNVLVKGRRWVMGDLEWCGCHDWRLCLSHLAGWWIANGAVLRPPPTLADGDGTLHLEYQAEFRSGVPGLVRQAYDMGARFATEVREPPDDFGLQLAALVATLLLGDLRFVASRGFDPAYAVYLLGESIRIAHGGLSALPCLVGCSPCAAA